jgi:hypothetical protein
MAYTVGTDGPIQAWGGPDIIDSEGIRMRNRVPSFVGVLGASVALGLGAGAADAFVGVHAATASQRAAILRAFVREDGSTAGVRAVFVANANHRFVAVCLRTPDAGRVGFVFTGSGRSWRFLYRTGDEPGATNPAEARVEGACLHL